MKKKLTSLDVFFDFSCPSCLFTERWRSICVLNYLCTSLCEQSDMTWSNFKKENAKTYRPLTMSFRAIRESIVSNLECRRTTARLTLKFHLSRWIVTARSFNNHSIMVQDDRCMLRHSWGQWVRAAKTKLVCVWIAGFSRLTTTQPRHGVHHNHFTYSS